MKIMVIGASGALGTAVSAELSARHETVAIGRTSGDFHADMRELTSLRTMFQKVGKVDAIVCTAGSVHFGPWSELTPGLRINAVSPTVIEESMSSFGPYFRGYKPVPASDAALAYSRSVEGKQTGQVYKVWR